MHGGGSVATVANTTCRVIGLLYTSSERSTQEFPTILSPHLTSETGGMFEGITDFMVLEKLGHGYRVLLHNKPQGSRYHENPNPLLAPEGARGGGILMVYPPGSG